MAADSGYFRVQSLNMARGGLLPALRHNKRELPERVHIDTSRTHQNYSLTPKQTAQDIDKDMKKRLIDLDIEPRKNAVIAIEAVFSLPASWHSRNNQSFFVACLAWITGAIQGELLSFDVHLDEAAPHAHALILPIKNQRLQGWAIMGGKGNIYRLHNDFAKEVGIKHGLRQAKRLTATAKAQLYQSILSELEKRKDPILQSILFEVTRDAIRNDPLRYAEVLGVAQSKPTKTKQKGFVEIMTKPVKCEPKPQNRYATT